MEFYEEHPTRYDVDIDRHHRWIRGDWQITHWLLPRVSEPDARRVTSPLPSVAAKGPGGRPGFQLEEEVAFTLAYERTWRFAIYERRSGSGWEFPPHAGIAVGTVRTFANIGAEFRAGLNLPDDFGTPSIGPSATTSTPVDGQMAADRAWFDLGAYLFLRVDGRAVARNIFLDGNTFSDSPSVDKYPFVSDLSAGVAMNIKNTKIA